MKIRSIALVGCFVLLAGCSDDNDNNDNGANNDNNFSSISRAAYAKPANGVPEGLNDREIVQDVSDPNYYNDLLTSGTQ